MAPLARDPASQVRSCLIVERGRLYHSFFRLLMVGYRSLFARRRFYPFNRLLFNLSLRGLGILNNEKGSFKSTGEAYFLRAICSVWKHRPTILDVGANVGEYCTQIKRMVPSAKICAFEPHPKTFPALQRAAAHYGYPAYNVACGDSPGKLALYDYHDQDGSPHASVYREVIESLHKGRSTAHQVDVIVLDEFITHHQIDKVDLIKIDAEGHELKVLAGLRQAISQHLVDVIHFEFNSMNVISRTYFRDFFEFLRGYRLHRMLRDGLVPFQEYSVIFCELYAFQNIVAIRENCGLQL